MIHFLRAENGADVFQFACVNPSCEGSGVIAAHEDVGALPIPCPEGCGAYYIRSRVTRKPRLIPIPWQYRERPDAQA